MIRNSIFNIKWVLLGIVVWAAAGCSPTQQKQVAQALQTSAIIVQTFQQGEIAAHQAGTIPDADHLFIQKQLLSLAQSGKAADSCVKTATNKAGWLACLTTEAGTIDALNQEGALYLKSDKAKTDFNLAMIGIRTSLQTIEAVLGGTQ